VRPWSDVSSQKTFDVKMFGCDVDLNDDDDGHVVDRGYDGHDLGY